MERPLPELQHELQAGSMLPQAGVPQTGVPHPQLTGVEQQVDRRTGTLTTRTLLQQLLQLPQPELI
jgi:hypothetical protein